MFTHTQHHHTLNKLNTNETANTCGTPSTSARAPFQSSAQTDAFHKATFLVYTHTQCSATSFHFVSLMYFACIFSRGAFGSFFLRLSANKRRFLVLGGFRSTDSWNSPQGIHSDLYRVYAPLLSRCATTKPNLL